MLRRPLVVIGLLGSSLDRGRDAGALERVAAHRRPVPPRRPRRPSLRAAARQPRAARSPTSSTADIGTVSPETDGAHARGRLRRSVGLRAGLREAPRLRAGLSVRSRSRGLSRARDDRHARRADLPVPADRDAPLPGAPAADRAAEAPPGHRARLVHGSSIWISRSTTASRRASASSSARTCRSSRRASRRAAGSSTT